MFEPISQSLYEIMMFAVLGFILAALYEPLRIIRLFVKTGAVWLGIQDFLFLAACGLAVFAYSLEFGAGHFRYFYVIGIAFGAAVYFLTVGRLIALITRAFAEAIKNAVAYAVNLIHCKCIQPLCKIFVRFAQKIKKKIVSFHKFTEKRSTLLKSRVQMKYNDIRSEKLKKRQAKMKKLHKAQENQHEIQKTPPIKARIRKGTRKA
jgi:hypothetical protein